MIKQNYLKIFILLFVLLFSFNCFSDDIELYGPDAPNHIKRDPVPEEDLISDDDFNLANGVGRIPVADVNAIKQIVIAETTTTPLQETLSAASNIAYPVTSPSPLIVEASYPTASSSFISAPLSNVSALGEFTTRNITNVKVQDTPAPTYALINATTKEIYALKDANTKYNPSGLTNLMTAYIAVQHLSLDATLTVNASAVRNLDKDASIAALKAGDIITLRDALASMFVKGCVDSANVVAENVAGSISDFVTLMNTNATALGLTNTKFVDPSGIGNNESTALDMAIIMAKVCENSELVNLLKLYIYELPKTANRDKLMLYSRNTQLNKDNATYNADVVASRLAYTSASKYCIASLMQYNNCNFIAVSLKAEGSQFSSTKRLFDFAKQAN